MPVVTRRPTDVAHRLYDVYVHHSGRLVGNAEVIQKLSRCSFVQKRSSGRSIYDLLEAKD